MFKRLVKNICSTKICHKKVTKSMLDGRMTELTLFLNKEPLVSLKLADNITEKN